MANIVNTTCRETALRALLEIKEGDVVCFLQGRKEMRFTPKYNEHHKELDVIAECRRDINKSEYWETLGYAAPSTIAKIWLSE